MDIETQSSVNKHEIFLYALVWLGYISYFPAPQFIFFLKIRHDCVAKVKIHSQSEIQTFRPCQSPWFNLSYCYESQRPTNAKVRLGKVRLGCASRPVDSLSIALCLS